MAHFNICPTAGLEAESDCSENTKTIDIFVNENSTTPVALKIIVHKPEGDKAEIELPVGHRIF